MTGVTRSQLRWTAHGLHRIGLTTLIARLTPYARRIPAFQILVYHRVNDDGDGFFPAVPVKVFEQQMAYVARTYRVLTIEDLVDRLVRGDLPRNTLAITFDDGYRDTRTHAAPILARHGLPATVFLATSFIGTAEVPWVDRLAMALKATKATSLPLRSGKIASLASESDRVHATDLLLRQLKRLHDDDRRIDVTGQRWHTR